MGSLATIGKVFTGLGLGFDFLGLRQQGQAAEQSARARAAASLFEAKQFEELAGQALASSQRSAGEAGRVGEKLSSRALALSAASGGGVATDVIADLDAETAFLANTILAQGETKARTLRLAAAGKRFEAATGVQSGEATRRAFDLASVGTIFKGVTLFGKYGGFENDFPNDRFLEDENPFGIGG